MPLLQFTPLPSRPSPSFFSALTTLKLDILKLDDSPRPVIGYLEEGRSVVDRELGVSREQRAGGQTGFLGYEGHTSVNEGSKDVWIAGCLAVDGSSFDVEDNSNIPPNSIPMKGTFRNFNTIEEFRKADVKTEMLNSMAKQNVASWSGSDPIFNSFLLLAFSDLKKYKYTYQFAFPVIVQKPAWEFRTDEGVGTGREREEAEGLRSWTGDSVALRRAKSEAGIQDEAFLLRQELDEDGASQYIVGEVSDWEGFFAGVDPVERTLVFHDPSTMSTALGWTLRNILHYLHSRHQVHGLRVIALRSGPATVTKVFDCQVGPIDHSGDMRVVGWEKNSKGAIVPKVADLGSTMDPARLADQAVDLNLKLMRWRVMPNLNLEKIAVTKCLLLGAGTLGCYVARCLMGWGVRNITFVDSAKVSYSNPVRQPLFEFADCLEGGKPKAQCAADSLKRIFPGVNSKGIDMMIPMPGHPVAAASQSSVAADIQQLERLMAEHDAIFLLMDSRESRWLPTLIGTAMGKIVINAALGFDSWLVMRHGVPPPAAEKGETTSKKLGCYYCNDVVAPTDSLTDRSLDQMCTVTRPGIAPIAAATAVEVLVSLLQHPKGAHAPADLAPSIQGPSKEPESVLGLVPHQLRGFVSHFRAMLIEGASYDRCTGCSQTVIDAYRSGGFDMLLRAFNENDYLEKLTGLDKVHEEGEAMMEALDWDEGSNEEDGNQEGEQR